MTDMRRLKDTVQAAIDDVPILDEVFLPMASAEDSGLLLEGLWLDGRFKRNIRIDRPTHLGGDGDPHAHVYGRKGDEIVAVNLDGSPSHGTTGRLHSKDADKLRARGFQIPSTNIIEWWVVASGFQVLHG
ncbi:MAG: hypothetical protein U1E18_03195 [Brevundimonas sp.]|uniref:hypothetical protein n=1 Tax=Brevundimonas sp. TaxID=1871086 RepID=UPI002ABCEB1C|nr:hypothetical protein [Brevundimonas sp.]MDZ4108587.1 hypothetical protein [Brevundimonas sp.]